MGKIIGITGKTGVVGELVAEKLIQCGYRVVPFENDIRDMQAVLKWIDDNPFYAVLHLAALVPVDQVEAKPFKAYNINVGGTLNLLNALTGIVNKPWFFYASTSHVYKSSDKPLCEDDPAEPITLYGKTKYYAEEVVHSFSKEYEFPVCIGRIFSFYHETQKKPFLYPAIKERLATEDLSKPFYLKGAQSIRDLQSAENVAQSIIDVLKVKYTGLINIGSGKGISIQAFVRGLVDENLDIVIDKDEKKSSLIADVTKLAALKGDARG